MVVAASGGPDSTALLHVLAALRHELDLKLVAVYIDHGLRPEETGEEEAQVLAQAEILGIEGESGAIPVREYAAEHGLSLEHAGRLLRYEYLFEIASKYGVAKIVVAHTADDQAEELLLRLIRGTGRKGLSGMAAIHSEMIIRPFLTIPKKELLEYLADKKISFLEDSSNRERIYLRNRVRMDLLPFLEEHFNPNIRETLQQTAVILQDEEALLEKMAQAVYEKAVIVDRKSITKGHEAVPEPVAILTEVLLEQPRAIQRRIVEAVCWQMESRPSFRKIEQILDLARNGKAGGLVHLAQGLRVGQKDGRLLFCYPQGKTAQRGDLIEGGQAYFEISIHGAGGYPVPEIGKAITIEILDTVPSEAERKSAAADYLDFAQLHFPLTLRSPLPGDRFHPLGAPGTKKVGDFLTDLKVPKGERGEVAVLTDETSIVAIIGLRIGHHARITENTRRVVKVTVKPL